LWLYRPAYPRPGLQPWDKSPLIAHYDMCLRTSGIRQKQALCQCEQIWGQKYPTDPCLASHRAGIQSETRLIDLVL